ncbi:replication factor RFC1 C terminal domain-containing protein [Cyathus striatus]|nr:replication factor RFC1 C terminal domain-containing protein [Cyathus striatus]
MASKPGAKATKPGGKDIRMFFSASSSKPKPVPASSLGSQKSKAIEVGDDDDDAAPSSSKPKVTKPRPSAPKRIVDSDDEPVTTVKKETPKTKKRAAVSSSDDEDPPPKKKAAIASSSKAGKEKPKPRASTSGAKGKSKKVVEDDDFDMESPSDEEGSDEDFEMEEEEDVKPKKATKTRTPAKKPAAKSDKPAKAGSSTTPALKNLPDDNRKPLAGLTFVFTGEMKNYSREDIIKLTERYGGQVASQPSSKSDYVVVGENVSATKLTAIQKHKMSALDENEFYKLISTRQEPNGKAEKTLKKGKDASEAKQETPATAKKFNWAAAKAAKLAGPVAHGSKEVPDGDPNALAGLAFVFTGELSSFSRDEAFDLAKRFGARVVLQPSSKTDFVVLGENAGPSKLAAINKHNIRTLNEDEFLELIGTRKGLSDGNVDDKTRKKIEKEQADIQKAAREMEKREKEDAKEAKDHPGSGKIQDPNMQLWTSRYAPQNLKEVCGNKGQVEKLQQWLVDWPISLKSGFKKPGKSGLNVFRAVLITGSPGIGKTTSAHLCAKLAGYTPIELNASDTRSKKLVENGMNVNNSSLDGFIHGAKSTNSLGVPITDKSCLIMDEVDGMSAGDRGGVGALNAMIKKTKIPIICIANDRGAQKLKPLIATTFNLPFHKPQVNMIRSRILTIAFKEKMKVPANVIDQLITGAQSDIRQVLNMLSTWKLSNDSMSFDEGKNLAKMNEKYAVMTPFDITSKMLGPYLFSSTSRETLGEKMDYYFQDHSFVPLFIQENYLKTQPARTRNLEGPELILKQLELMDRAASSISDGDLVDALIHGPEQHWSLMPLHAVLSTVRPASSLYGTGAHYGGQNAMTFPAWLGQNSKQAKLNRQLSDVQVRMRLRVSGDKGEIRQSYIPALFPYIVKPLMDTGASAVEEVIDRMDEYFLSKDDWDTVVELGVGDNKDDFIMKKISTATKTALTKKYNAKEHPIPFHKAQDLGKAPKKLAGGPAPDLEEAFVRPRQV